MRRSKIFYFYHYNFDNDHLFGGHIHDNYEANIVIKGNLELTVDDKVINLRSGDMAIWPAKMFHRNRVVSEKKTEFYSIHFSWSDDNFVNKDNLSMYKVYNENFLILSLIESEVDDSGWVASEAANALFEAFILRSTGNEKNIILSETKLATIYHEATTIMNDNNDKFLSVSDIAHRCGICETTLKRAFKYCTGISVKKYYSSLKIETATKMLLSGIEAKSVANKLGFSSLSYFSQFFKRETSKGIREFLNENLNRN